MRNRSFFTLFIGIAIAGAMTLMLYYGVPGMLKQEGQTSHLFYLVFLIGYLLWSRPFAKAQRNETRNAFLAWIGIAALGLLAYSGRHLVAPLWTQLRSDLFPGMAQTLHPHTVQLAKDQSGHFHARALVNGSPVFFLIDTGATKVTLTPSDARKIGIDMNALVYNVLLHTANGPAWAAAVSLESVSIGEIVLHDVRAYVSQENTGGSLLGMSFLSRLKGYRVSAEKMILEQ